MIQYAMILAYIGLLVNASNRLMRMLIAASICNIIEKNISLLYLLYAIKSLCIYVATQNILCSGFFYIIFVLCNKDKLFFTNFPIIAMDLYSVVVLNRFLH